MAPRICSIIGLRRWEVSQEKGGYRVVLYWRPMHDEMWEILQHFALFGSQGEAEKLAAKARQRGSIDLNYWVWSPTQCSCLGFMHDAPTAKLEQPSC